jgi:hypothetical protein
MALLVQFLSVCFHAMHLELPSVYCTVVLHVLCPITHLVQAYEFFFC